MSPCCFAEAFDALDRKITRLKAESKKAKEDLDSAVRELSQYRAAYGDSAPEIKPTERPCDFVLEVTP